MEILIPDFRGRVDALECVLAEQPDVVNLTLRNSCQTPARCEKQRGLRRSLTLLARAKSVALSLQIRLDDRASETDDEG